VNSTSQGIGLVAEGFPWKAGDNLVTFDCEFPANVYPWQNLADRGVETRLVPAPEGRIDLNRLEEACDPRTRIVAISWVQFAAGWRIDVDAVTELAHRRGALVALDAIQGLGVFPLDVSRTPVDFLAADGHKWLLGPEGAGIFYLRGEHLNLLAPRSVGWNSVVRPYDFSRLEFSLKPTAARYEGGTHNMAGFVALGESLKLLSGYSAEAKAARVLALTDRACQRLQTLGAEIHSSRTGEERSGIVLFSLPGQDSMALRRKLHAAGVALSCRAGKLRISPHAYGNEADIERLIGALEDAMRSASSPA
jgi:selenocysteine lyase/cysteine desulfurase